MAFKDLENMVGALRTRMGNVAGSPFSGDFRLNSFSPFKGATLAGSSPFRAGLSSPSPFAGKVLGAPSPFAGRTLGAPSPFTRGIPGVGRGNIFGNPLSNMPIVNPYAPKPAPAGGKGGGEGGTGGWFTGAGTADENQGLTAQRIDQYISATRPGSPLVGMGRYMLDEANRQGISVAHLLGIMLLESGLGTEQGTLPGVYNYGGLTGSGWEGQTGNTTGMARAFATFDSKEHGIKALIANLASPLYKGKSIAAQTSLWYLGRETAGLDETDEAGNASVRQYLDTIGGVYQALGVPGYNPNARPTPAAPAAGGTRYAGEAAITRARSLMGTPYVLGGLRGHPDNPRLGLDCSEFTGWALGLDQGLWHAQTQYDRAAKFGQDQARAGDLVFFTATDPSNPGEYITHVGLYLGNGRFINSQDGGVMEADLNSGYWRAHLAGFGRL